MDTYGHLFADAETSEFGPTEALAAALEVQRRRRAVSGGEKAQARAKAAGELAFPACLMLAGRPASMRRNSCLYSPATKAHH